MPQTKNTIRVIGLTLCFVVLSVFHVFANRAIEVQLRTQDRKDAPVSETVQLYGASHALVIGIDDYTNGWPRLSGAVNDARQIADVLERKGFSISLKTNLTALQLKAELETFFVTKGADKKARLFVWFAGHGHTINGEGFLIPADAPRPENKVGFKLKALPMRRFGEYVRLAESKHAMAVFDSCFSGTIFTARRSTPPAAVTRATTLPVRQFVSSGDANQEVSDNGLFRRLFVRALEGETLADANRDGYVTGSELGMFLTDRMTNLTASAQTPRYGKLRDMNYDRGDFVFILDSPETAALKPAPRKPDLPKDSGASLDDLLNESKRIEQERSQWSAWLAAREQDVAKGRQIDNSRLSREKKKEAWKRIYNALDQDNPYSTKDDEMRRYAMGRINFWDKPDSRPPAGSPGKTWTDPVTGMEFVWVPKGCFRMGSNSGESDEKPVHEVCVDGFWMGKYEVTIDEFRKYLEETGNTTGVDFSDEDCPIVRGGSYGLRNNKFGQNGRQPMVEVSWNGAKAFAAWLSKKGNGTYRLPTEAEWEYAARSGGKNETYAGSNSPDSVAWYMSNSGSTTHPVGQKKANGLGLFDMSGNVWEWCEDIYAKNAYSNHSRNNPIVTSGGSGRVVRGGGWGDAASSVRCSYRNGSTPFSTNLYVGFRLVRTP